MTLDERLRQWSRLIVHLGNNILSLLGAALTTGAAVTLVWFCFLEMTSPRPYTRTSAFSSSLILPAVFLLGLLLIPVGLRRQRHRLHSEGQLPAVCPAMNAAA